MLSFSHVKKSFNNYCVLDDINLHIERGHSVGLIGANGEGKTTLFKSLLNVSHIDSGEITILKQAHTRAEARLQLTFLPEHFQAPYYLNGREFLHMMLKMQQAQYHQQTIEATLKTLLFDINALDKPVRTYSKGMMQKLGLSACLCSDKPLLILDEPMSGLDPAARHALKQLLNAQKDTGKTLLFSTHLLHDIEMLCDRIIILANKRIQFYGTIPEAQNRFNASSLEQAYLHCIHSVKQHHEQH